MAVPPQARIIEPQEGNQYLFLVRDEFEILFGGAAGPGKTWGLVYDALGLQYKNTSLGRAAIEFPNYKAVLFRRKTTNLGDIIDEAAGIYCTSAFRATYTSQRKGDPGPCFTFPYFYRKGDSIYRAGGGAKVYCCHLEEERDKRNHQGWEYQYEGWDELTQFLLTQYLYLFSRARPLVNGVPPRIRGTANPEGEGLWWVKKRFIDGLAPYKTGYFIAARDPEENPQGIAVEPSHPKARSRLYIPGFLDENKRVDTAEYEANVSQMGELYERALLHNDWDAFSGDFFSDAYRPEMFVPPFEIPPTWRIVGSLDPGWSSPCSFGLHAIDHEGRKYRIATYYEKERSAPQHARAIKAFIEEFPLTHGRMPEMIVCGADAFDKKDKYAMISTEQTLSDVFAKEGLYLTVASTERVLGWWAMKSMMREGKWLVFEGFNNQLRDEIVSAPRDEKQREDIKGRGNDPNVKDHSLDEDRYMCRAVWTPQKPEGVVRQLPWMQRLIEKQRGKAEGGGPWKPGKG